MSDKGVDSPTFDDYYTKPGAHSADDRGDFEGEPTPFGGYWAQSMPVASRGGQVSHTYWWVPAATFPGEGDYADESWGDLTDPENSPGGFSGGNIDYRYPKFPSGNVNEDYIAPGATPPELEVQDGWPPDVTGAVPPPDGGSSSSGPPPSHPAYSVDMGSIRGSEQDILTAATTATTAYQALSSFVASTNDWVFATDDEGKEINEFNYEASLRLAAASDNLLLATADAIHGAGAYIAALNAAAQVYANADELSFVPED